MATALRFLTDARTIQSFLNRQLVDVRNPLDPLVVDGAFGPKSIKAAKDFVHKMLAKNPKAFGSRIQGYGIDSLPDTTIVVIVEQIMLSMFFPKDPPLVFDGVAGPSTRYALEKYQDAIRDMSTPIQLSPETKDNPKYTPAGFVKPDFGRQSEVVSMFGNPADEKNLVRIPTPYPLYLDWQLSQQVNTFLIHKKVADSAKAAMQAILDHYGKDEIHKLGLDQFGGCYNPRKMRGGSSWSMHAWGIAIDWDADRNGLRSNAQTAYFSTNKKCHAFLDIWEAYGWTSLGRTRNYDWMHVQAPRL